MGQAQPAQSLPLSGVRVLDLTRVLAGPFCTMILADLGAEVVKVERPGIGDDARGFGPFLPSGTSAYYASINRGKKSIELDLKSESGLATFLKLAERADVVVENFRPSTMDSLGIGAAALREINPRLIVASTSGFGATGRYGNRAAYDIVIQAVSGLMSLTGHDAAHPVRVGTSISDILSGLFTAVGIVAGLRQRETTGAGTTLDVAMLDCTVAVLENAIARYDVTGEIPQPLGTRHPSITPFQAFETLDASIVVAAGNDALFARLCRVLGADDLPADDRFATNVDRTQNRDALEQLLGEKFRMRSAADWLPLLEEAGVPSAPIRHVGEVVEDPHLKQRGMIHPMTDADGNGFRTAGSPLMYDGRTLPLAARAPELGDDTATVLRDWLGE